MHEKIPEKRTVESMHPNSAKLLSHADWLRRKAVRYPQAKKMLDALAEGMEEMSKESINSPENQYGETVLQKGIVDTANMLAELGDSPDNTLFAQMAEDVMLPIPFTSPLS